MKNQILLVGAGPMATEYAKVLEAQNLEYSVVGNTKEGAASFELEMKKEVVIGGLNKWMEQNSKTEVNKYKVIVVVNENLSMLTLMHSNSNAHRSLIDDVMNADDDLDFKNVVATPKKTKRKKKMES